MLDVQILLGSLSDTEFDLWCKGGSPSRMGVGETVVGLGDFPDLILVLEGCFAISKEISPSVVGLDSFLTGLLSDREWITDTKMVVLKVPRNYNFSEFYNFCCNVKSESIHVHKFFRESGHLSFYMIVVEKHVT